MDVSDSDAHSSSKRLRLDSGLPAYAAVQPHHSLSSVSSSTNTPSSSSRRPSQQLALVHDPSPTTRSLPPHCFPPPSPHHQSYALPGPGPGHRLAYGPSQPSPSLPTSLSREHSDPRTILAAIHRPHDSQDTAVSIAAATGRTNSQEGIYAQRSPVTNNLASAPDLHASASDTVITDAKAPVEHNGMEHGGPPAPWPVGQDSRQGSISNAYPPSLSPPIVGDAPYHNPSISHNQHYAPTPSTGNYSPSSYIPQYGQGPGQIRRKQVRATQACNHCRSRKQKCDEARPCQFCRENGFDCQYKDVPVPKQDRSMMQLQDSVNGIIDTLKRFMDSTAAWHRTMEGRLPPTKEERDFQMPDHPSPRAERRSSGVGTPGAARSQIKRMNSLKGESPSAQFSQPSPLASSTVSLVKQEPVKQPQPPATPAESMQGEQHHDADTADDRRGLESDHTTPAHLLLTQWKWMSTFYEGIPELKRLEDAGKEIHEYPMVFERDRGLLRTWGVGEGHNADDGTQGPGSPGSANDSDAPSPESGSARSLLWGYPPAEYVSTSSGSDYPGKRSEHPGGLNSEGRPDFRQETLWKLHAAYRDNIHCLHPLLNPKSLVRMVKEFGDVYSPEARAASARSPTAATDRLTQGVKRKRVGAFGNAYSFSDDILRGSVERSMGNAIILLVLALGKVALHEQPLPAPQPDRKAFSNGTWASGSYSAGGSFGSEDFDSRPRNIDVLPGLAYFAIATDILGNQQGGNTIVHAQANLLAALYLSQFARVLESWSWINNACRICLVLIKADYDKIERDPYMSTAAAPKRFPPHEEYRLNLIKYVYWTCLQLETDILAEMSNLSPTDISKYQTRIMYPTDVWNKFPESLVDNTRPKEDGEMLWTYSSLIHLRVFLNAAHNHLYRANLNKSSSIVKMYDAARCQADILGKWRTVLPPPLAWNDDDPPSTDINIARVRAKYYGARYMTQRRLLEIALNGIDSYPGGSQESSPAAISEAASTPSHGIMHRGSQPNLDQAKLVEAAADCILSAIRSTIAFDRVGADHDSPYVDYRPTRKKRLTLTNIVGTLHAQFGNMIVLAATYKSDALRPYLPPESQLSKPKLSALFGRTINILQELAPNSPTLQTDLQILLNVKRELALD